MKLWDKAERLWTRVKNWKTVRGWHIWKLKLVDARLYFVSMFVGLLTGLVAVPYHYLLYYLFHLRSGFFASHPAWYWHIPLFLFSWGILVFVMWLVGKMPLIGGGGIPQTRGVINGRLPASFHRDGIQVCRGHSVLLGGVVFGARRAFRADRLLCG